MESLGQDRQRLHLTKVVVQFHRRVAHQPRLPQDVLVKVSLHRVVTVVTMDHRRLTVWGLPLLLGAMVRLRTRTGERGQVQLYQEVMEIQIHRRAVLEVPTQERALTLPRMEMGAGLDLVKVLDRVRMEEQTLAPVRRPDRILEVEVEVGVGVLAKSPPEEPPTPRIIHQRVVG